jgi:Secretion system C-terminal sorting domain
MTRFILCVFIFAGYINLSAQSVDTCIVISARKDAFVLDRPGTQSNNYGAYKDLLASAVTYGGDPAIARTLIHFNLTYIPPGAVVTSADLSLFYHISPHGNGTHDGDNAAYIQRVTSSWNEMQVSWNNQPSVTPVNQVFLPPSLSPTQDYLDIDVLNIVEDMIADGTNDGLSLRLQTEGIYRELVFASREEPDTNLHPRLEVCYTYFLNTHTYKDEMISVFPNPVSDQLTIRFTENVEQENISIYITDEAGKNMLQLTPAAFSQQMTFDIGALSAGIYFVHIATGKESVVKKLVKL